jgi:hypothetical protein
MKKLVKTLKNYTKKILPTGMVDFLYMCTTYNRAIDRASV